MKLKQLGANRSEVTLSGGTVILFSYRTPVAAQLADGGFIRTETNHSRTTSKHITQWLEGAKADSVAQSVLNSLVKES